ncbi:MAG TPA: hypothetical protein VFH51_05560, partial [Myxococcota bacterium]|nr:hypothetical protein [Myxococcota bacterium]
MERPRTPPAPLAPLDTTVQRDLEGGWVNIVAPAASTPTMLPGRPAALPELDSLESLESFAGMPDETARLIFGLQAEAMRAGQAADDALVTALQLLLASILSARTGGPHIAFNVVNSEPPAPGRPDLDNVMYDQRTAVACEALAAAEALHPAPVNWQGTMNDLRSRLNDMRQGRAPTPPQLLERRLGDTELNNASRALFGAHRNRDRTAPLCTNPVFWSRDREVGIAEVIARVHALITAYVHPSGEPTLTARDQGLMWEVLWLSFARCIDVEDDEAAVSELTDAALRQMAFRVCPVGVVERSLAPLPGYFSEVRLDTLTQDATEPRVIISPGQLVTEFVTELDRQERRQGHRASAQDFEDCYARGVARAAVLYGADAATRER